MGLLVFQPSAECSLSIYRYSQTLGQGRRILVHAAYSTVSKTNALCFTVSPRLVVDEASLLGGEAVVMSGQVFVPSLISYYKEAKATQG